MTQTEYAITDLASILKAMNDLPEHDKAAYNVKINKIEAAAREFFHTRTNSELMDIADEEVVIGDDRVSIYDYMGTALEWYTEEADTRNWPIAEPVMSVVKEWYADWATEDDSLRQRFFAMEKQVRGLQKKLDRIAVLLKDAKFTISGETALKL